MCQEEKDVMKKIKRKIYKKIMIFSLTSMLFSLDGCKNNHNDESVNVNFEKHLLLNEYPESRTEYEFLDSIDELKNYFTDNVTFNMVRESLNNNLYITDEYREYTHEFINLVEQKFSNLDLTIFNENIKIFQVNEIPEAKMKQEKNREAYYDIFNVIITMHDEHENIDRKKYCYFHELWHMFNNLYLKVDNTIFYKTPTLYELSGTAFDEGMNTFLTEQIMNVGLPSYTKQYDQIKILYIIYGDELLYTYLDSGIEGVEMRLSEDIGYQDAYQLIKDMNSELNGELSNPISIFDTLIKLYLSGGNESRSKSVQIFDILENVIYTEKIKKDILLNFDVYIGVTEIPDDALVSFDNVNFYKLSDLYLIECNSIKYIVNNQIVIDFFNRGIIRNIYDIDTTYIGNNKIKMGPSLKEFIKYGENIYSYDEKNRIVYINEEIVKDECYVKSK